jgi:hypothetical protein
MRSTVAISTVRCASFIIGTDYFIEEIIGYGLLSVLAISNENVYKCLVAQYQAEYPPNRKSDYVPKSRRKKSQVYLWWLELCDTVKTSVWCALVSAISSTRIWKKGFTRSSIVANRQRAKRKAGSVKTRAGYGPLRCIRQSVARSTCRVISKCYMTNNTKKGYPSAMLDGTQNVEVELGRRRQKETDQWDTDSFEVKVDSGCSMSLSGDIADFVPGTLQEMKGKVCIQSYGGGRTVVTHSGTILWRVVDDSNVVREIKLPGALYVPGSATRLLSP